MRYKGYQIFGRNSDAQARFSIYDNDLKPIGNEKPMTMAQAKKTIDNFSDPEKNLLTAIENITKELLTIENILESSSAEVSEALLKNHKDYPFPDSIAVMRQDVTQWLQTLKGGK